MCTVCGGRGNGPPQAEIISISRFGNAFFFKESMCSWIKFSKFSACGGLNLSKFFEQHSADYQSDFEKTEQKKCAKSSAPQAENFQNLNADF